MKLLTGTDLHGIHDPKKYILKMSESFTHVTQRNRITQCQRSRRWVNHPSYALSLPEKAAN